MDMTVLTLKIPVKLAKKVSETNQETILAALEKGLQMQESETEHPHITREPGVLSGRPVIRGTRIPVWHVAKMIIHHQESIEDFLADTPHVTAAQAYDALSYYFDHRDEIEAEITENRTENITREFGLVIDGSGIASFNAESTAVNE